MGASGVKMLQFSDEGARPAVLAAAHYHIPPSLEEPEDRRDAVRQAIVDALRHRAFRGRETVTALGHREFQMKNIRLPRMPAEEKASAIEFEAEDRFGMSAETTQFRHITAGEVRHGNDLKEEIIVFAAEDGVVDERLELLESVKLRAKSIEIGPCAVARSFMRFLRRGQDTRAVNVFLDVGRRGTSVILTHGHTVSFVKVIELGGQDFDAAVSRALSIPLGEVGELRVRIMAENKSRRGDERGRVPEEVRATVSDAVRPVVERITRDVQLCLRYFTVTFRGLRPSNLTLVGGEANEPSLLAILREGADVPCTIGDPLRGVARLGGPEQRTLRPAWALACGLALRGTRWVQKGNPHASGALCRQTHVPTMSQET